MEHNRLLELLRRSGHRIGMSAILPGGIMGTAIDDRMLSHTDAEELYWKDRHEEIERRADEIIALPMGPDVHARRGRRGARNASRAQAGGTLRDGGVGDGGQGSIVRSGAR